LASEIPKKRISCLSERLWAGIRFVKPPQAHKAEVPRLDRIQQIKLLAALKETSILAEDEFLAEKHAFWLFKHVLPYPNSRARRIVLLSAPLCAASPDRRLQNAVEAHICGDQETTLTEVINGEEVIIADCRVHDILTFQVPEDLPEGIYGITVIVPNTGNFPGFDPEETSFPEQFIRVVPSETTVFQIASAELSAVEETSPESFGSDKVTVAAIGDLVKTFGLKGLLIALGIALVVVAVEFFVALWAPADLLIEDATSFTILDLAERTSANFPSSGSVQ